MCMLTYLPEHVMPDVEALTNGATLNDDGHGFAVVIGHEIMIRRSMDAEFLIAHFASVRKRHPDGPALFHSRMSTGGATDKSNCHPFKVGGDSRTVMAHNGILPSEWHPSGKHDVRSDTRYAAEEILPSWPLGSIGNRKGRKRLGQWIGRYNKLVFLTVDPRYQRNSYIINPTSGEWHDRVWYSNEDYRTDARHWRMYTVSKYGGWRYDDDSGYQEWWSDRLKNEAGYDCTECLSTGTVNYATSFCSLCHMCNDCVQHQENCLCYLNAMTAAKEAAQRDYHDDRNKDAFGL